MLHSSRLCETSARAAIPVLPPLLMVVALLGAGCGNSANEAPVGRAEFRLPVQAAEVVHRDLSRSVRVAAPVEALRTTRLATSAEGVVTEIVVEEGDRVSSGQVVARIDVSEQRAELARARARLDERRAHFDRLQDLRVRDYVDAGSFDSARAELEVARSEVQLWETRVGFGTVTATGDGTVIARHVEPGEAVSRHAPVLDIADLDHLVVRLGVSELDVVALQADAPVEVRIDALDTAQPLEARIRRIFPAAEAVSRLVIVEVELPGAAERGIRPGYLARAELVVDRRERALAVPAGALGEHAGGHYVMVINAEDRLERRNVRPGITRGAWQEVLEGLAPGERVVATNPLDLNEDARVRIVGWAG
jgi:membrane fusion protein, multidrug efflux system